MIGKFALFFLLAFVSVQDSEARIASTYEDHVVLGIWDTIQDIINQIKNALGNIANTIKDIFEKLKHKIEEIINGLNLPEIIEQIKEKIMELIGEASELVHRCVDEQMPAIEALAQQSQEASMACVMAAQEKMMSVQAEVEKLIEKAEAVKDDVIDRATKCVKDNILHPTQIIECVKQQMGPITEEISALKDATLAAIEKAKNIASEAGLELSNCMSAVAETVAAGENEIMENIRTCLVSKKVSVFA